MKKVLLTGATGFVGRHCLPLLLAQNYEVHAVYSKVAGKAHPHVQWHKANLLNSIQVSKLMAQVQPSHLLHLAWYAVPGKYWTSLENFRWVQASLDLLQTFVLHGGHRAVMAGTCAEYDWKYGYCSEQITPLLPATLYGTCKHSLQVMLDAFSRQTGLSSAWARVFFLYGPHEHPGRLVPSVICSLLRAKEFHCHNGNQIRDFLYVEDVASAFVALLFNNSQGVVNIGSGNPVSLREVVGKIGEKIGQSDLISFEKTTVFPGEPPFLVADNLRLKQETSWNAQYNLDKGLDKTIQWWKEQMEEE